MKFSKSVPAIVPAVVTAAVAFGLAPTSAYADVAPSAAVHKAATATQARAVDATWLRAAAASDLFEIASGTQAASKAEVAGTKRVGLMIKAHHTAHLKEVRALAAARRVTLPTTVLPADAAVIAKLDTLSGLTFDRNWLRTQAAAHRKTYIATGLARQVSRDPQVLDLERRTLPVVKLHQFEALFAYGVIEPASEVTAAPVVPMTK